MTSGAGGERRQRIVEELRAAPGPLSGTALGAACGGVSRQVVVQDIALLREGGVPIVSTNRGYVLEAREAVAGPHRLFKCRHTTEQVGDELNCIVDLGACVEDVVVNHRVYGRISTELNIRSRRDVAAYVEKIRTGKSTPLMLITSGYHFHHVSAASEEVLDEVGVALAARGYLAELTDFERESSFS